MFKMPDGRTAIVRFIRQHSSHRVRHRVIRLQTKQPVEHRRRAHIVRSIADFRSAFQCRGKLRRILERFFEARNALFRAIQAVERHAARAPQPGIPRPLLQQRVRKLQGILKPPGCESVGQRIPETQTSGEKSNKAELHRQDHTHLLRN